MCEMFGKSNGWVEREVPCIWGIGMCPSIAIVGNSNQGAGLTMKNKKTDNVVFALGDGANEGHSTKD